MRTFGTIVFGLVFILAFIGFFVGHSVAGYPLSTSDVVDSAKEADLYGVMLQAVNLGIEEAAEQSSDPELARKIGAGLKDTLQKAITEEWFYESFATAHAGFVKFLEGGTDDVQIDLGDKKAKIREFLEGLAQGDEEANIDRIMKAVPDKVSVSTLISKSGGDPSKINDSKELKDFREGLATFKTVRTVTLIALVVLLGLIALIASKTRRRLLVSTGIVLFLAGGIYLGGTGPAASAINGELKKDLESKSHGEGKKEAFATEATAKVFTVMVDKAVKRSNTMVMVITVIGLGLLVAGFVVKPKAEDGDIGLQRAA